MAKVVRKNYDAKRADAGLGTEVGKAPSWLTSLCCDGFDGTGADLTKLYEENSDSALLNTA